MCEIAASVGDHRTRETELTTAPKPITAVSNDDYEIRVIGAPRTPLRDFYHALLRLSWPATIAAVVGAYLAANALFAGLYLASGGVAHARPGSLRDAFFFSIQTMGTIGYGAMYPETDAANLLVTLESVLGLVLTALTTGLVFARFSRPTARLVFSERVAISPMDGVPTLAFRVGNRRGNRIVEALMRVALVRTELSREGHVFYRMLDLKLSRERMLSLTRAWTVLHPIDETSPLFGETPESLTQKEVELLITVSGTDDIWMQTVVASHRYGNAEIVWGARLADVLSEDRNVLTLDLRKFHDLESTKPSAAFPYPRQD